MMIARSPVSVRSLYEQFSAEKGHKRLTREAYLQSIRLLEQYLGRPATIDDFSKPLLIAFRTQRLESGSLTPTCNKDLRHLKALWQYAFDEELLESAPRKITPLKEPERSPVAWRIEELQRLVDQAARLQGYVANVPRALWWQALLLSCYETGGRITAILEADAEQFDRAEGTLLLDADDQKQTADQLFRLSPRCAALLDQLCGYYHRQLFVWPYKDQTRKVVREHYRKFILRPCGLPETRLDLFHKLRKTNASYYAAKTSVQAACEQLGHSSPEVTKRYLDPGIVRPAQAVDCLPEVHVQSGDGQLRLF